MKLPAELIIKDYLGKQFNFYTVETLKIFLEKEYVFWSEKASIAEKNPTANQFIRKSNNFQRVLNDLTNWEPSFETWDESTFNSSITNTIHSNISNTWLWSGYPFIEKWLEINQNNPHYADGFFEATVLKNTNRQNDFHYFNGYLMAYEYAHQDKTSINKRRTSEVKSLNNLRDSLIEKHNELIENVDSFKTELVSWKNNTQTKFSDWYEKKEQFNEDATLAHSKSFQAQYSRAAENISLLENKFREKLRFESPAAYWNTRANSLKDQGNLWTFALVLSIIGALIFFSSYFVAWLDGSKPTEISLHTVEGIILFAAILSSFAFLIKTLSKLAFSSYHLMRDSEEREQLTHLYIALRDGKDDDPEARKIILQTLFSRSDSGLLTGDHSPTMPSVAEVVNIASRVRS